MYEKLIIKNILNDNDLFHTTKVEKDDFLNPIERNLFGFIGLTILNMGACNTKDLKGFIENAEVREMVNSTKQFKPNIQELMGFINGEETRVTYKQAETRIKEESKKRKLEDIITSLTEDMETGKKSTSEMLRKSAFELSSLNHNTDEDTEFLSAGELVDREIAYQDSKEVVSYYKTGINVIDDIAGGVGKPSLVCPIALPKSGKATTYSTILYTPTGSKTMGEIQVGGYVFDEQGKSNKVIATHEQGITEVYRVNFNDGNYVDCNQEHLWKVQTSHHRRTENKNHIWSIKSVVNLIDEGLYSRGIKSAPKFYIPFTDPVEFENREVTIHPYLMGCMLGDGHIFRSPTITNGEKDVVDKMINLTEDYSSTRYKEKYHSYIVRFKVDLFKKLEKYNLGEVKGLNKFIPEDYLYNSIENRLEILRGLFDTDGCVEKGNALVYYSISKNLADGVKFLVESLGGVARITTKKNPFYKDKEGNKIICNDCYRVTIQISNDIEIFSSKKHRSRFNGRKKPLSRNIVSIEKRENELTKCITVENESHLYLTNNFIVTHNSSQLYDIGLKRLIEGRTVVFATIEINSEEAFRKIIASYTRVLYHSYVQKNLEEDLNAYVRRKTLEFKETFKDRFFMLYKKTGLTCDIIGTFVSTLSKVNIKVDDILIDYLGLLTSNFPGKTDDTAKYASLPRELRILSQITNTMIVAPHQLSTKMDNVDICDITMDSIWYAKTISHEATFVYILKYIKDETKMTNGTLEMKALLSRIGLNSDIYEYQDFDFNKIYLGEDTVKGKTDTSRY